jgi:hypothetical protein
MWSRPDILGLFSNNVGPFSRNVVLSGPLFSINLVPKTAMLSGRGVYVLSPLQLGVEGGPELVSREKKVTQLIIESRGRVEVFRLEWCLLHEFSLREQISKKCPTWHSQTA